MKWISVEERLPKGPGFIVAIMGSRAEENGDPIEDAEIVILRSNWEGDAWLNMDSTKRYYLPNEEEGIWYDTINYWIPWEEFGFPESMIINKEEESL